MSKVSHVASLKRFLWFFVRGFLLGTVIITAIFQGPAPHVTAMAVTLAFMALGSVASYKLKDDGFWDEVTTYVGLLGLLLALGAINGQMTPWP